MLEVAEISKVRKGAGHGSLKRIALAEWEEYVGRLDGVEEGPEGWVAIFDHVAVILPAVHDLSRLVGKKVGILHTEDGYKVREIFPHD